MASTPLLASSPVGMVESAPAMQLVREGLPTSIDGLPSATLMAGDRLTAKDEAIRGRMLNGSTFIVAANSTATVSDNSLLVNEGMVLASLTPESAISSEGLSVRGSDAEAPSSVSVERKSPNQIEVVALSGGAVVVKLAEDGSQLGVVNPGDAMTFTRSEAGLWSVQAPMVLQQSEGVEEGTEETDETKAAAAPAAAATGGGAGGTTTAAAIGGGVVVVGGGTAVAASPRLRERLGVSQEEDTNEEDSSPTAPPPPPPQDEK